MNQPVRIAVAGPAGRLGSAILKAAATTRDVQLVAGLARPGSAAIGLDLAAFAGMRETGVKATDNLDAVAAMADVLIDVSTASAAADHAQKLAARGGPGLIIGATGFEDEEFAEVERAATKIPIVCARNFSLGVTLLAAFVRQAAGRLGDDWDIEIVEMHHRAKADAPSGTALMLGEAAAKGRGVDFAERAKAAREGMVGPRTIGDIGFATLRGGGVVGDHQVIFAGQDEMLTLSHRAMDRTIFAKGALAAARWIKGRKPGLYGMDDVLGLG